MFIEAQMRRQLNMLRLLTGFLCGLNFHVTQGMKLPMKKGQIHIGLIKRCTQNKGVLISQSHGPLHNLFNLKMSQITQISPPSPP
jgi:hypothetical protein